METKHITCTVCPRGCAITATKDGDIITVEGASCDRGRAYAKEEMICPKRMLTTTCKVSPALSEKMKLLPVRSAAPVPKELLFDIMEVCREVTVEKKVSIGDTVIPNVLDTGVDIIAAAAL